MTMAITVIGWMASVSLLAGYRLVTTGRVHGESLIYLALNMFGSVGLGLSTAATHSWPSAANNLIWLGLGVVPLTRALRIRARIREPRAETAAGVSAR